MVNGYHTDEVDEMLGEFIEGRITPKVRDLEEQEIEDTTVVRLQYRGTFTDRLIRKLWTLMPPGRELRFVRQLDKLGSLLPSLKAPLPRAVTSCVVYNIKCEACNADSIG